MGFLSPNHVLESKPLLRNNLKTLWSKLSAACLWKNNNNNNKKLNNSISLSTSEIKRRMVGIPVHVISNYAQCGFTLSSDDRSLELYYISKSDAQEFLDADNIFLGDDVFPIPATCRILDVPLSHVVEDYDYSIMLVPELSQVKNAIELINKDGKEKVEDLSFTGVPVFQSDCMRFTHDKTGETYSPAFLRKEDLENLIDKTIEPDDRDIIKVSAFEDIIQKMKDNSTSESNDIFFVGAGITSWTWFQT